MLARDKQSSLLQTLFNYSCKKFNDIAPVPDVVLLLWLLFTNVCNKLECLSLVSLTNNHWNMPKMHAKDKHTQGQKLLNYSCKKFNDIDPVPDVV